MTNDFAGYRVEYSYPDSQNHCYLNCTSPELLVLNFAHLGKTTEMFETKNQQPNRFILEACGHDWDLVFERTHVPRCSMYGISTYMWVILVVNVSKYSIHGAYGVEQLRKSCLQMGVSSMGNPKWMVYNGKSHLEVDDDWGGYPYFRNPSYGKNTLLRVIPTMANHDDDHRETRLK